MAAGGIPHAALALKREEHRQDGHRRRESRRTIVLQKSTHLRIRKLVAEGVTPKY